MSAGEWSKGDFINIRLGHTSTSSYFDKLSMTGYGNRYCGVPVWKLDISAYERLV